MYLLGYDIGSSSVKACLVEAESGKCVSSAFFPKTEAPIIAVKPGWAEQNPESWWENLKLATKAIMAEAGVTGGEIKAIGISYQMHGLVCVDKNLKGLRPSIIWCDSRAVPYGEKAFADLGKDKCLGHLLNSPGNFTAAKLAWVKENEPQVFNNIYKVMIDYSYTPNSVLKLISPTVDSDGYYWFELNENYDYSKITSAIFLSVQIREINSDAINNVAFRVFEAERLSFLRTNSEDQLYFKQGLSEDKQIEISKDSSDYYFVINLNFRPKKR